VYEDEDLIPISALQHHMFCQRQCALIHVDGLWAENRLTVEGRQLHEHSDARGGRTSRGASTASRLRIERALPLVNRRLGLAGRADQVEFPLDASGFPAGPPKPVEHKRGQPKRLDHDRVQLAAQAICLEEMFGLKVPDGELFYHAVRRREHVSIGPELRDAVERIAAEIRINLLQNAVPAARKQSKCRNCSLLYLCMPGGTGPDRDPRRYISRSLHAALATGPAGGEP